MHKKSVYQVALKVVKERYTYFDGTTEEINVRVRIACGGFLSNRTLFGKNVSFVRLYNLK